MSDVEAEFPASQDASMWWNEGEWQPIPSGMLSADTSPWVLAINDAEYPALSELIRYADDVNGYLEMLGVSGDSTPEQNDSPAASTEDEEFMEMGE